MKIYDIIIVGAGPSGSTAAYYINGKSVLIVDKFDFPRDKACGGGLLNCRDWSLEFDNFKKIENRFERYEVNDCEIYLSAKHCFPVTTNHFFDQVKRSEFDTLLLQEALKKENVEWKKFEVKEIKKEKDGYFLSDGQEKIWAKKIIGADGVGSKVSLFLGNSPITLGQAGNCLEYDLHCEKLTESVHLFFGFRGEIGYTWIFPTKNGYYIGLGYARKTKKNLKYYLDDLIQECIKKKIIPEKYEIKKIFGGLVPVMTPKKYCTESIFLCGDAAGMVSQWSGEGIYFAIKNGKKLGQLLSDHNSDLEKKYKKVVRGILFWRMRIVPWIPPRFIVIPFCWIIFKVVSLPTWLGVSILARKILINMFSRRFFLPQGSFYKKF